MRLFLVSLKSRAVLVLVHNAVTDAHHNAAAHADPRMRLPTSCLQKQQPCSTYKKVPANALAKKKAVWRRGICDTYMVRGMKMKLSVKKTAATQCS
jgi:hypothetical protein